MRLWKWFRAWLKGLALRRMLRKAGGLPSTLEDTFPRLTKLLPPDQLDAFKRSDERSATAFAHLGLGMWMRNNWGLWKGGPLAEWFKVRGIIHADDMSGIILTSFHRKLRGEPLGLMDQIEYYRKHWKDSGVDPDTMKEIQK